MRQVPDPINTSNTSSLGKRAEDDNKVEVIYTTSAQNYPTSFADVRSALEAHVLENGAIPKKNLICKYDGNGLIFEETGNTLDTNINPSIIFADPNKPLNISPQTIASLNDALSINEYKRKNFFTISKKSDHNQNIFSQTEFDEALKNYVHINGMPLKDLLVLPIDLDGKKSLSFSELNDSSSPFIVKGLNKLDTITISDDLRSELERIDNSRIDNIKEALKKLYEANPSLTAKQAIIDVYPDGFYVARNLGTEPPQGSTSFNVEITSDTQQKIKTIVALKTLYRKMPNLDITQAIIEVDSDGKYVARVLTDNERKITTFALENSLKDKDFLVNITLITQTKIKAEIIAEIKAKIEAEKFNDDLKTISSFFATPDENAELSDQTSTSENVAKIKKLLTRVLTTDEKETESEKDIKKRLKAHFVEMTKADMEKSFRSGKQSKLEDLMRIFDGEKAAIELFDEVIGDFVTTLEPKVKALELELELDEELKKSKDAIDALELELELELEHEEDIETISSFFATPAPNNESSDQTSTPENADKIIELLTRVVATANFDNPINKKLKEHLFLSVELATKNNPSKVDEVLGILENFKIDDSIYNTRINSEILKEEIIRIKNEVEKTAQKEAEEKTKKEAEERTRDERVRFKHLVLAVEESENSMNKMKTYLSEDDQLKKQKIKKAKNEELLLSRVRLYIKENYPQLPISIDQTSSPLPESKNYFKALLESEDNVIATDYTCKKIGKAEIYENNETKDFFVVLVLKGIKGKDGKTFVFDKNDILDDDLKAHIEEKDQEISKNLSLIATYFERPDDQSLKTKVSDLLKKEFEIMRYSTFFKSIYGNEFKKIQGNLEEGANKTKTLALYDDCKFDLMNQYFKDTSSIFLSKRVYQLLKNNDDEYLNKFEELLTATPRESDTHKKANLIFRKVTIEKKIDDIDDFFTGNKEEGNLEEYITKITNAIAVDEKLMKHFQNKLNENSQKITSLRTLLNSSKISHTRSECVKNINKFTPININAKKILTSAQMKIKKTTKLVGDVFHSISSSGTQASEALAVGAKSSTVGDGSDEQEKNVHAIKVFLSQLKSVIDKGKNQGRDVQEIKDAFSLSLTEDADQASKKFKIEFFNSLVDTLNNDEFTKNHFFLNFLLEESKQQELFKSFSRLFNGETIGALTTLGDSIETKNDSILAQRIYITKRSSNTQLEIKEIIQTKKLVYDAIFGSLFKISKERPKSSASASADNSPASIAGSPSAQAQGPSPASATLH